MKSKCPGIPPPTVSFLKYLCKVFSFQASYSRRARESSSSSSSSSDELPAEVSDLQRTFTQIENEYNQRKGLQTEASTVR